MLWNVTPRALAAGMGLLLATGCTPLATEVSARRPPAPAPIVEQGHRGSAPVRTGQLCAETTPLANGGSAVPNGAAYDGMFFQHYGVNPFVDTEDDRLSTFALDVDTASFAIAARYLGEGHLPPPEAIRVEELLNALDYHYPAPRDGDFRVIADGVASETGKRRYLVRFGLRARDVAPEQRPSADLVFVVDVSGSMNRNNRLGAVRRALAALLDQLRPDDRVGLVVYGSRGEVVLEPTADLERIRGAIERLQPGGSTNVEEGLTLAYELARRHARPGAIRRLILCSDGVANVGRTDAGSILERVGREARRGIQLSTIGFGMGNYNDVLMEQLADHGDGAYAYVDSDREARRVFVEQLTGTLLTIGFDAKVQVEWNPAVVQSWRLVGYENREVRDEDFRNDDVDAGEIGAGHQVTALFEIKLVRQARLDDAVLATLRLRYRKQAETEGEVVELATRLEGSALAPRLEDSSPAFQLAWVAAALGERLRQSYWARQIDPARLERVAQRLPEAFDGDERVAQLVEMVRQAAAIERALGAAEQASAGHAPATAF